MVYPEKGNVDSSKGSRFSLSKADLLRENGEKNKSEMDIKIKFS